MGIFPQNEAPLEVGNYCRVCCLSDFMCLQIICLDDTEGRTEEKRKPVIRTKRREATRKRREGLGLIHKGTHWSRVSPRRL